MKETNVDTDYVLPRFNRLIQDVIRGNWQRTAFEPWEITILLDIQSCEQEVQKRRDLLVRYQKAVQRQLANRRAMPMMLSEYVRSLEVRLASRSGAVDRDSELIPA
jgi:hypothetical protein